MRKKAKRGPDRAMFRKTATRTKKINVTLAPRGGYRL